MGASLRLDAVDRILAGCAPALEQDDRHHDAAHDEQRQREYPPLDGRVLGEVLQRLVSTVERDGRCYDKADEYQRDILLAQHRDNLSRGGPDNLADANLLAPVLALEHHQAEHPNQGDERADNAEDKNPLEKRNSSLYDSSSL